MPQAPLTKADLQEATDAYTRAGGVVEKAAVALLINRSTFQHRLREAKKLGFVPSVGLEDQSNPAHLKLRIKRLESELRAAQDTQLDHTMIKNKIIGLSQNVADIHSPVWVLKPETSDVSFGVPTLMVSDLHAGEIVKPSEINGVNEFNLKIFHDRMQNLAESSIRLLKILSPGFDYPGIVVPLGGDNITGNI